MLWPFPLDSYKKFSIKIDGLSINNLLLVDPVVGGLLPALELLRLEPESDLLLGRLDGVGAVADVAADVLRQERNC